MAAETNCQQVGFASHKLLFSSHFLQAVQIVGDKTAVTKSFLPFQTGLPVVFNVRSSVACESRQAHPQKRANRTRYFWLLVVLRLN